MALTDLPATGQLRESINIQRLVSTGNDGAGNVLETWQTIYSGIPARIAPKKGTEVVLAQGLQAVAWYDIWVRYSSEAASITEADIIVNARTGQTYNVRYVSNPDEKYIFLKFVSERGVAS